MLSLQIRFPSKYRALLLSVIISVITFLSFYQIRKSYWDRTVVTSDGFGYYSYLPAVFIYNDLQYTFFEDVYKKHLPNAPVPVFCNEVNGKMVNKYFSGVAVLLTPFFGVAHASSYLFDYPSDGYSDLYQLFVGIGALFYLGLGCLYCLKILKIYNVPAIIANISIIVIVFGTNLFHYVVVEPSMSHVYSFASIAAFIYYLKKYSLDPHRKDAVKMAFALSIILLIRPINGIILFSLPFICGSWLSVRKLFENIIKDKKTLFISVVVTGTLCLIQPILYYFQTGSFFVWSYKGEGFNFLKPEIINVLFSYKKGWFVYTPAAFISLLAFLFLYRKNKFEAISLLLFFALVIYVLSCWWHWQYGMSFGLRAFIDYYPFLAIMVSYCILLFSNKVYKTVIVLLFLCTIVLNLIQAYQYRHFILHWDKMDKEKYWTVFLKTNKEYEGVLWK